MLEHLRGFTMIFMTFFRLYIGGLIGSISVAQAEPDYSLIFAECINECKVSSNLLKTSTYYSGGF